MVNVCRWEYRDNSNELNVIKEFTENYTSDQAIHWYTRDSFLYRLLNKALRSQNIDIIFKFRLIIADVYKQLNELFEAQYPIASVLSGVAWSTDDNSRSRATKRQREQTHFDE